MTPRERIEAVVAKLGLSITAKFVPWSLSRNAGEKHPSLNWKVTIWKAQPENNIHPKREVLTTDFMMGCANCKSYKQSWKGLSADEMAVLKRECETGRPWGHLAKPVQEPDMATFFANIASDCDAIDSPTYEQYASDHDTDPDSREGEAMYRLCLEFALSLRAAVGDEGLRELREAARDF